jgi:FMN-dependent NADH-azoreductase
LLHIDSSAHVERSNSCMPTAYFVEQMGLRPPKAEVDYRDIAADPLPHVSDVFTVAVYPPPANRTEAMQEAPRASEALADRLLAAASMARLGCADLHQLIKTLAASSL